VGRMRSGGVPGVVPYIDFSRSSSVVFPALSTPAHGRAAHRIVWSRLLGNSTFSYRELA